MRFENIECKCKSCVNLNKVIDEKDRVHYQCPFVPEREYLGAICDEELNPYCGKYQKKFSEVK